MNPLIYTFFFFLALLPTEHVHADTNILLTHFAHADKIFQPCPGHAAVPGGQLKLVLLALAMTPREVSGQKPVLTCYAALQTLEGVLDS